MKKPRADCVGWVGMQGATRRFWDVDYVGIAFVVVRISLGRRHFSVIGPRGV